MPAAWVFLVGIAICGNAGGQTQPDDHGDTFADVTIIGLDESKAGVLHGGDVDYFALDVISTVDVSIFTKGNTDTVGELFDSSFTLLTFDDDGSASNTNFLIRGRLSPSTYYIVVSGYFAFTSGAYTLTVQTDNLTDMHGDTFTDATMIDLDTPITAVLHGGDVDYFRIEKVNSTVDVSIFTKGNTDTVGRLYDGLFNIVAFNDNHIEFGGFPRFSRNFRILERLYPDAGPYYIEVRGSSAFSVGAYTLTLQSVNYTPFSCPPSEFNDPLYGCQWHLKNTGQSGGEAGEDINVESVWETYKGDGVHIAVVDEGMHFAHEDLKDNVDTTLNYDYTPETPLIYGQGSNHGTAVSGLIAARDENGLGVRGVAPRATIYGYNLIDSSISINEADAMTRNRVETDVSNNSWGSPDDGRLHSATSVWEMAIETGVNEGADGKGIVYVWAAGNGAGLGDNANHDGHTNYYAVTTVCAVNNRGIRAGYSEPGANLWVCAPSGDRIDNIVTTDNAHRYRDDFSGTSAAVPIVSGVVALVRQANPELSWRDVKLILAASARWTDMTNSGWEAGAYQYQSASERYSQRYRFNHEYGFGVVDAQAAVDLAQDWKNVPSMKTTESAIMLVNQTIPDNSTAGVTHRIEIASDIEFIEFVEINVDFDHPYFVTLDMQLMSPSGAVSKLIVSNGNTLRAPASGSYRFGSAKHLGEDPSGIWQLKVFDLVSEDVGRLNTWSLKVYGHSNPAVMIVFTEVLTEENLADSTLVVTITDAVWNAALAIADFSLAVDPASVSVRITGVERNTDTTATLTLAFDGTDFDDNAEIRITALATAHSGNDNLVVESPIIVTANHEATGAPVIEGVQQVGMILTATTGTITDGNGLLSSAYEWQWQVSADGSMWTDIPGANTAGFIPAIAHQGQLLRVIVSFTDDSGFQERSISIATAAVLAPPSVTVFTAEPLTELNLNGATLTLVITGASWETMLQVDDFSLVDAPLGVGITAVERDTDTTARLTVEFNGTDFDDNAAVSVQTSNTAIAEYVGAEIISVGVVYILANDEASGVPSITGILRVGFRLTATMGDITDGNGLNGMNYEWQWQVSADGSMWTDIPIANTAEFIPAEAHQGQSLRVIASFTDRDGFRESSTSTATEEVLAPPSVTVFTAESLTELNLNGATLTLVITGASWETTLQVDNFSLVDAPLGVGITAVERNTDTTAILTVEFNGTDFDDNAAVSVQTSNTAIAEYVGAEITSTDVVDILANDEASGAPSIMGILRVGFRLTATMGDITDGNGLNGTNYEWQWQVSADGSMWTDIPSANTAEFIPVIVHQGKFLRVVVSFTDDDGFRESSTSTATEEVLAPPSVTVFTAEPLTELNLNGATLTLVITGASWETTLQVADFSLGGMPLGISIAAIERDTDTTARLIVSFNGRDFDTDATVTVQVSNTAIAEYVGAEITSTDVVDILANDEASGAPSIMGILRVGFRLTATMGDITDGNGLNGTNYEWQWQVSADGSMWTDIPSANTAEFIPVIAHQGKFLRVMVSFTDDDGFRESSTSTATGAVLAPPSVTVFTAEPLTELNLNGATLTLVITGASWETTLQVADFSLGGMPLGISIAAIERDTDTTARLIVSFNGRDFDTDATVTVQVSNTAIAEYVGAEITSTDVVDILANDEASGAPSIMGILRVGFRLTATMGDITDGNGLNGTNYEWQWQVSADGSMWTDIPSANTAEFIPVIAHQGKFLRVMVSFTDDDGFRESSTSTATGAVLAPPSVTVFTAEPLTELNLNGATLTLVITGASWETTLQVADFSLGGMPLGISIAAIERDTDTTARLIVSFNGRDFDTDATVTVQVSNTAIAEYVGAAVISTSVVDILANDEAVGEPMVIGVAQVGMILTATTGTITDGDGLLSAVYEWQWQVSADGSMWTDIPSANTAEFIPVIAHQGKFLRVMVSFTDDDGFRESSTSTATGAVLAPPSVTVFTAEPLTELNLNGATLTLVITGASWETTLQVDDFSLVDAPLGVVIAAVERNTDTTAILTVEFNGTDFDDNTAVSVQTSNTTIAEYVGAAVISTGVVDILANDESVGEPMVIGVAQVGMILTATTGTITDGDGLLSAVYEWQWQASTDRVIWSDIEGADTETLIPLPVHQDQFLRVLVSFTDDAGFRESSTSTAMEEVFAPPSVTVFTAEPLTELNLNGATLTLVITGASWETTLQVDDFSLVDAPLGVVIAVVERNTDTTAILTVEFNGTDFDDNTAVSVQTSNTAIAEYVGAAVISTSVVDILANDESVGEPMVIGVAQVGVTLTATIGTITDGNGLLSSAYEWQWQVSTDRVVWEDIEGAATADFMLALIHQGQFLRVLVSFTDDAGFRESSTSTATEKVLAPPAAIILVPQAAVGSTYDFTIPDDILTELGDGVLNYMITGLPDSLSFNEDDRTINGVPESTGIYTVVIEVSNLAGLLVVNFELIIVDVGFPIVVNPLESYEVVAGVFFEFRLVDHQIFMDSTPIGGTLMYRVMSEDLPSWLTFNNGVFSGIPDGGVRRIPVSVFAMDEDGNENVYVIAFDVLVNLRMRLKVFLEGAQ